MYEKVNASIDVPVHACIHVLSYSTCMCMYMYMRPFRDVFWNLSVIYHYKLWFQFRVTVSTDSSDITANTPKKTSKSHPLFSLQIKHRRFPVHKPEPFYCENIVYCDSPAASCQRLIRNHFFVSRLKAAIRKGAMPGTSVWELLAITRAITSVESVEWAAALT